MMNASGVDTNVLLLCISGDRQPIFVKDMVHLRTFCIQLPGSTLVAVDCSFWSLI